MRLVRSIFSVALPIWFVLPLLSVVTLLSLSGGYLASIYLRPAADCPKSAEVCATFDTFWEAWSLAERNFVDEEAIDPQAMTDGAIAGMLDSLGDRGHTRYLSAEAASEWQQELSGSFEGIGAYVDVHEDGQPFIVSPIEESPAERAGIRAGDLILAVDGEQTLGMTVEEVVSRVRGPAGTSVTLTILHEGEELPVEITITRAAINVPDATWSMLEGDIAYVRFLRFNRGSADDLAEALQAARDQGARAVLLDLRNNPGGLVSELVDVASQFLPPDTTVLIQEDRDGQREEWKTEGPGLARDLPLVVLMNGYSASAAEILAGALQDAGRAQLVGVPTSGTGTVLSTYTLNDGSQVLLGTSQWLTPGGRTVRGEGISPDIIVQLPVGDVPLSPRDAAELSRTALADQDAQLSRALEVVEQAALR